MRVSSPFLWLLHLNRLRKEVQDGVGRREDELAEVQDIGRYFANGITLVPAHTSPSVLVRAAAQLGIILERRLTYLGRTLGRPLCRNLVGAPGRVPGYVCRRQAGYTVSNHRDLQKHDRETERWACSAGQWVDGWGMYFRWRQDTHPHYGFPDPLRRLGATCGSS